MSHDNNIESEYFLDICVCGHAGHLHNGGDNCLGENCKCQFFEDKETDDVEDRANDHD